MCRKTKKREVLTAFLRNQKGQDLIEYALLAGFVAVAVAAFFPTTIVPSITTIYSKVEGFLSTAASLG